MAPPVRESRQSIDAPSIADSTDFTLRSPTSPPRAAEHPGHLESNVFGDVAVPEAQLMQSQTQQLDQRIPPYDENPYAYQGATNADTSYSGYASVPPQDSDVQGPDATYPVRRLTSIRSFVSRATGRRSHETSQSHGSKRTDKGEEKDVEHEQFGPQHLLDAIAEEADDDSYLMGVQEAADEIKAGTGSASPTEEQKTRRKGYRENLERHRAIKKYTAGSRVIARLRNVYRDILSKTVVTRAFIYWLPLALVLFIPLAIDAWSGLNKAEGGLQLGHVRVMWLFIWLEVAWGSLWFSRVFAHYVPEIAGFVVSIIAPGWFKFIDLFVAMELPLTLVLWTLISMVTFIPVLSRNHKALKKADGIQNWQRIINNILVALLVSALVFFVEQLLIHFLSVSYHKTRMAQRIKRNKRSVNILALLLYAAYSFFPPGSVEFAEEDELLNSNVMAHTQFAQRKFAHVGEKFKLVANLQKALRTTANQLNAVTRDLAGFDPPEKVVKNALLNKISRETLAQRIWKSLVMEDSDSLSYDDVLQALGEDRKEEVLYIFDILDLDGQGDISLDEMVTAVRGIGKEQKHISKSLQDIDGAITKLHQVLMVVLLLIIIIIFVGMLAPSVGTVLATLGSSLLALSFIFSATAQEILASCVYLFVKHPCDVGDIVMINVPGVGFERMRVIELSLLYSVFQDDLTMNVRQASNAVLNTLFVDNITRSPPQTVPINLILGLPETTMEQIDELRSRILTFLADNPREYMPDAYINVTDYPDLDRVKVTIIPTLRNNMEDGTLFGGRRTRLFEYVSQCVRDIPLHTPRRDEASHDPAAPMFVQQLEPGATFKTPQKLGKRQPYGMMMPTESVMEESHGTATGSRLPRGSRSSTTRPSTGLRRTTSRAATVFSP